MQEKTKNVLLVVLIVGLVSMTVAYAALSTTLTISSSAKVAATKWDIKITDWTQAAVQPNAVRGNSEVEVTAPTITDTSITGLAVKFKKPGDKVKFTFKIQNHGDIDAQLTAVTLGEAASGSGVTNTVTCANATPTANTATFDLTRKVNDTPGSIDCEMEVSLAANHEMPTQQEGEQTVTISDTVFTYGQK